MESSSDKALVQKLLDDQLQVASERLEATKRLIDFLARFNENADGTAIFEARTNSAWSHEGETNHQTRSKSLRQAIQSAFDKHCKANNRCDLQGGWNVRVKIKQGDKHIWLNVPPELYNHLLPSGDPTLRLRLKRQ